MGLFGIGRPKVEGIIKALKLEDWYLALTPEQQEKLKKFSGEEDRLVRGTYSLFSMHPPYTQKRLLSIAASNALQEDPQFAKLLALKGLLADGNWIDQHFLYNTAITAFIHEQDYVNAKKYCLDELKYMPQIRSALIESIGIVPPSIPFRDSLIYIVNNIEKNYNEARKLVETFIQNGFSSQEDSLEMLQNIKFAEIKDTVNSLFLNGEFDKIRHIIEENINELGKENAAYVCKLVGDLSLEAGKEKEAFEFYQKAQKINPLIRGLKKKIGQLAKKFNVELDEESLNKSKLNALKEKEESATEIWEKLRLADECSKNEFFDKAWSLYNETLLLEAKEGRPLDNIYRRMARSLEREKKFEEAILHYLLEYRELLEYRKKFNVPELPAEYIINDIEKCLNKLGISNVNPNDIVNLTKEEKSINIVRDRLEQMLKNKIN